MWQYSVITLRKNHHCVFWLPCSCFTKRINYYHTPDTRGVKELQTCNNSCHKLPYSVRYVYLFLWEVSRTGKNRSAAYLCLLHINESNKTKSNQQFDEGKTDQMAEWYRASASGSVDLGFDSESGQTNDLKIGFHSFPAWRSANKRQCGERAGKFTCCAVGKGT